MLKLTIEVVTALLGGFLAGTSSSSSFPPCPTCPQCPSLTCTSVIWWPAVLVGSVGLFVGSIIGSILSPFKFARQDEVLIGPTETAIVARAQLATLRARRGLD